LSQSEFAQKAGISRPMVDYYERRAPNPATSFVIKAAAALGVTTDELLGVSRSGGKVGRKSKLDRYVEQVKQLPRAEQQYVLKFLEQVTSATSG
jgi:transcriptional regulator with XRE-family HTH domain